jgi:hypothetical protein
MEIIQRIIEWTNNNSGFLSLIIFIATIMYGWFSGLFSSLIKKPKLSIRFIEKISFYSKFNVGEQFVSNGFTYEMHKTGFVVYMCISNVGNKDTAIDKIYLGYQKNKPRRFWNKKEFVWLPQWHALTPFQSKFKNESILIFSSLRVRDNPSENSSDFLRIGESITGTAYFEQVKAWGNYSPLPKEDISTDIKIKIIDVYGKKYIFKYNLRNKSLKEAREFNENFGMVENITTYS